MEPPIRFFSIYQIARLPKPDARKPNARLLRRFLRPLRQRGEERIGSRRRVYFTLQ